MSLSACGRWRSWGILASGTSFTTYTIVGSLNPHPKQSPTPLTVPPFHLQSVEAPALRWPVTGEGGGRMGLPQRPGGGRRSCSSSPRGGWISCSSSPRGGRRSCSSSPWSGRRYCSSPGGCYAVAPLLLEEEEEEGFLHPTWPGGHPGAHCWPEGCSRACTSPGAHRAHSSLAAHRAHSSLGAHRVRSRVRSSLGAQRVRSRARSSSGAHKVISSPGAHRAHSPEPAPVCEPTASTPESVPEPSAGQGAVPEPPNLLTLMPLHPSSSPCWLHPSSSSLPILPPHSGPFCDLLGCPAGTGLAPLPPSLPPLFVSVFRFFLSRLLLCVSLV